MGMTIDEAIEITNHYLDYPKEKVREALLLSIDTMRKYQKITKILNSASYTENGKIYSYVYDEDTRVKHIREVIEDGKA